MKKRAILWPVALGAALSFGALGCDGDAPPSPAADELNVSFVVQSLSSLPTCTSSLSGTVAFVSSTPPAVSVCNGTSWSAVACGQSNAGQVLFASTSQSVLAACVHSAWTQVTLPAGPTGATGATGATGTTGATGAAGTKSLVTTATEPRGANCFDGGKKVMSGLDTNNNGTLDSSEIQSTSYVCNSAGQPVTFGINGQPALEVTQGQGHTCALLADGSVWCWGDNYLGQVGNNTSSPSVPVLSPVAVAAVSGSGTLTGVAHIAAGNDATCAVLTGGTVVCWGDNFYGELATTATGPSTCGGSPCSPRPVAVAGLSAVTGISGGSEHFCAVTGAAVKCWGNNQYGQLGNGNNTGPTLCNGYACGLTPASVVGTSGTGTLTNVSSVSTSSGAYHTCAVLTSGAVDCWGINFYGQLGVGSFDGPEDCSGYGCTTHPLTVSGVTASAVAVGGASTCAIDSVSRTLECWGDDDYGQLGMDPSGASACLYGEPCVMTPLAVPNLVGVTKAAVGGQSICAAVTGGRELCLGSNTYGGLGDGTTTQSFSPVEVVGLQDVEAISVGGPTACAIESGLVECWGANWNGQAGNRSQTETHYPVAVQ